jgi:hypothetical protein
MKMEAMIGFHQTRKQRIIWIFFWLLLPGLLAAPSLVIPVLYRKRGRDFFLALVLPKIHIGFPDSLPKAV